MAAIFIKLCFINKCVFVLSMLRVGSKLLGKHRKYLTRVEPADGEKMKEEGCERS